MHHRAADVGPGAAPGMLVGRAGPRRHAAHAGLTRLARDPAPPWNRPGAGPPGPAAAAGQDIPAAERQFTDVNVLDQLLQMMPRPVETLEAAHIGGVQRPG